ncbi:S24/S26 family peptidase [Nocardioides dilutus]
MVTGDSMRPRLRPGDRLLVDYRRPPREGDVVVARLADGTVAVKRAVERRTTRAGGPGWWLLSDAPEVGVDSRHRGVVPVEDVLAVVRVRLWKPRMPDSARARRSV